MKKIILFSVAFILAFFNNLNGQNLYNTDVTPDAGVAPQDYTAMSIAPDGAVFILNAYATGGFAILKSTNNGQTFAPYASIGGTIVYTKLAMVIAGGVNDYKIFVGGYNKVNNQLFILSYSYGSNSYVLSYSKDITTLAVRGISMASDYTNPATGVSPYSIAMVVTERYPVKDSLRYIYSKDGGLSFLEEVPVKIPRFLEKVSVAYGYSASNNLGSYTIAYEDFFNGSDSNGHIGFVRENAGVGNGFTSPYWIDTVSAIVAQGLSIPNNCRNPHIATSNSSSDNDSSNYTTIIGIDRFYAIGDWDALTFINKNTAENIDGPKRWFRFDIDNTNKNVFGTYPAFNASSKTFAIAYFDSTNKKLAHCELDFNIPAAGLVLKTDNFCNTPSQLPANPNVQVSISPTLNKAAFCWTETETVSGINVAKYDRDGNITNSNEENDADNGFSVYPNPIQTSGIIGFTITIPEKVSIKLINMLGQQVASIYEGQAPQGVNTVQYNVANLPAGTYMITYQSAKKYTSHLIAVSH